MKAHSLNVYMRLRHGFPKFKDKWKKTQTVLSVEPEEIQQHIEGTAVSQGDGWAISVLQFQYIWKWAHILETVNNVKKQILWSSVQREESFGIRINT